MRPETALSPLESLSTAVELWQRFSVRRRIEFKAKESQRIEIHMRIRPDQLVPEIPSLLYY